MLYNVVLVSAVQQCKSVITVRVCVCVYIYNLPSFLSLPTIPHSTPLGCHRVPGWAPCVIQQLPTSNLFDTMVMYIETSLILGRFFFFYSGHLYKFLT